MKKNLLSAAEIGKRLVKYRTYKNITGVYFANKVGVSKQTISNLEHGKHRPRYEVLAGIIQGFPDMNPAYLFVHETEMLNRKMEQEGIIDMTRRIPATAEGVKDKLTSCIRENELLRKMIKDKEELIELLRKQ